MICARCRRGHRSTCWSSAMAVYASISGLGLRSVARYVVRGPRVQIGQQRVVQLVPLSVCDDPAVRVVDIAEDDRLGRDRSPGRRSGSRRRGPCGPAFSASILAALMRCTQ